MIVYNRTMCINAHDKHMLSSWVVAEGFNQVSSQTLFIQEWHMIFDACRFLSYEKQKGINCIGTSTTTITQLSYNDICSYV